jgi:hypothetical protein
MKRDVFATSNYYQKKWIQVRIDFHVVYKLHVGFEFLILQIVYFRVTDIWLAHGVMSWHVSRNLNIYNLLSKRSFSRSLLRTSTSSLDEFLPNGHLLKIASIVVSRMKPLDLIIAAWLSQLQGGRPPKKLI